ncbi:LOW QUALITY PROTEIN: CD180 antigen [Ammospiza maritima maritima]
MFRNEIKPKEANIASDNCLSEPVQEGQEGQEHGQEGQECGKKGQEDGQEGQKPVQEGQEYGKEGRECGKEGQEPGKEGQEHGQEGQEHGQEGQHCGKEGQEHGQESQEHGQECQDCGKEGQECGKEGQERGQESQGPGQSRQGWAVGWLGPLDRRCLRQGRRDEADRAWVRDTGRQDRREGEQEPVRAGEPKGRTPKTSSKSPQKRQKLATNLVNPYKPTWWSLQCQGQGWSGDLHKGSAHPDTGAPRPHPQASSSSSGKFATTEVLNFSFNVVPSLQNYFSELNSLFYLDITRCQISWEYDGAFPSNRQLKTVILTRNLLMFLSATAFAGPYSLGHLTQTGITSMFFIPMTNLGNLRYLILGSNHTSSLQLPPNFPTRHLTLHFHINNTQAISAEGVQALQKNRHIPLILKGKDIPYTEPGSSRSHFYSLDLVSCADIPGALVGIQDSTAQTFWLGTFYGVENEPYISPHISQGLCSVSVKGLHLQLWHLRNLNADTFQSLTRLQKLDLTQPHIHALPPAISGTSLLEEMVFNASCFEQPYISSAAFPSLTHLHIQGNSQVLQPGSGYLEKLAKLQHLDLSQSHFESCSSKVVRALSRLCYQNLSHSIHLHLQECSDSASLELLDLPFTPLYVNTLQSPFQNFHLANARDDLSSSHINTSIQHVFQGLKNLMFLDLSQNNFDLGIMPKDKLFQLLSNLEVLILNASCELTSVDNQVFHNLRKLQHVDLNYNKFTAFSTDAFSNPNSTNLSCVHNRTHTVSNVQLVPLDGHLIIKSSYDLLDCSWSKVDLITYKQYLNKIGDPERTRCSELKFLAVQLATILSCGKDTSGIIAVVYPVVPSSFGVFTVSSKTTSNSTSRMGTQKISTAYLDGQTELCWWYDPPVSWNMHHGELAQYHSCCVRLELLSEMWEANSFPTRSSHAELHIQLQLLSKGISSTFSSLTC